MKLLSKILTLAILPYQIMAMEYPGSTLYPVLPSSSSSSPVFPEYPDPFIGAPLEEIKPVHINRYSNPLNPATAAHVESCSRNSAIAFALLGGGATLYLYGQNSDLPLCSNLWKKMGFTVAGAFSSGALAYVTAKWITTNRTAEKQDEALANDIIDRNNAAFTAKCNLDTEERSNLNCLIKLDQTEKNHTAVYHRALTLHPSKQAREYPIEDAVKYLDGTANKIKQEGEALGEMKTERPLSDHGTISDEAWDKILKDVRQTHEAMNRLNHILPAQAIVNWTNVVKQLPEYTYQSLQKQLRADHKDLKDREKAIRYNLARLAALRGHSFSQAYLSQTFANHLWASLSTNYSNTPEGRRARSIDIEQSKNSISSSMQSYLTKANSYDQQVITYNKAIAKVPETIKIFVKNNGGNIDDFDGYTLNQNLLDYNRYLNHNNGDALWTWIESCFAE